MEQCCKKMPKIINMKLVRECSKSFRRPAPPQENPDGPPPPTGSPSGPPPTGSTSGLLPTGSTNGPPPRGSTSGPLPTERTSGPPPTGRPSGPPPSGSPSATPPPPTGGALPPDEEDKEFGEKDGGEPVETLGDEQKSLTSGKIQCRPGVRACRGKYLVIASFDIPYLLKDKTSPTTACFPQYSIDRTIVIHNKFNFVHNCMLR
jgi:hypothetical protein